MADRLATGGQAAVCATAVTGGAEKQFPEYCIGSVLECTFLVDVP